MKFVRQNWQWLVVGLLVLINFGVWYAVSAETRSGKLTVAFLDVGQGDAIFIDSSTGIQVLIDGGPGKQVLRSLSRVLPFYDRSIDLIIATHPDADHIGGLPEVLARYKVKYVIESGAESDTAVYQEFKQKVEEEAAEKILARRGSRINLGGGAFLDILFPDRDVSGVDPNDASIIARLIYGEDSFLLTGDSEKNIENYLVALDGERLNIDVLKVGHHGSKSSSGEYFIGLTSPEYAIISAGEDNRYGHPHKEVLETLEKFEAKILNTASVGNIIMQSDGSGVYLR